MAARPLAVHLMNGNIKGGPSNERWTPGDPLPWTASVCHGVPFTCALSYKRCLEIPDFETRSDDVFIVTYPKSGTTWMQQIVKCLKTKGHPETDDHHLEEAIPWFESELQDNMTAMPFPRTFKSHSQYHMIAKGNSPQTKCKYIHVMRHPKDVCVSLYHHMKAFTDYEYNGKFPEFIDLFLNGLVESGSWFDFMLSWHAASKTETVLNVMYEDMKEKPREVINKVAMFLGLECTDEIMELTLEKSSFNKMKCNDKANMSWRKSLFSQDAAPFMRKGVVGDWRNHFTQEQSCLFDAMYLEKMSGSEVEHIYDIRKDTY